MWILWTVDFNVPFILLLDSLKWFRQCRKSLQFELSDCISVKEVDGPVCVPRDIKQEVSAVFTPAVYSIDTVARLLAQSTLT